MLWPPLKSSEGSFFYRRSDQFDLWNHVSGDHRCHLFWFLLGCEDNAHLCNSLFGTSCNIVATWGISSNWAFSDQPATRVSDFIDRSLGERMVSFRWFLMGVGQMWLSDVMEHANSHKTLLIEHSIKDASFEYLLFKETFAMTELPCFYWLHL